MKHSTIMFVLFVLQILFIGNLSAQKNVSLSDANFIKSQVSLDYNNIHSWIQNSGTFNHDIRVNNTPGFMWPKGSNKFAIFTSGLSLAAYVNGVLRMATASYAGEYQPGTIVNVNGQPIPYTDSTFKLYKVSEGDDCYSNPDWANWGLMVPYGAPYIDANGNFQYDPCIDTPGISRAGQTVFVCLTDGFPENHSQSEGFSGGTKPLNAEVRLTAWCFDNRCVPGLENTQFFRWQVINKNDTAWEKTRFSIVCDPDLGLATDDYIGCDTVRQMAYCYNSDNDDGTGNPPSYGINPPAVGMRILRCIKNKKSLGSESFGCSAMCYFTGTGSGGVTCEQDPQQPIEAYNFMKGLKKDGSNWINPLTNSNTRFTYPGNPETLHGWSEVSGAINNCGNDTGNWVSSSPGDRRFVISMGRDNLTLKPYDTMEVIMTQLIAKGSNNLNAVTKLLRYSDVVKNLFEFIYNDEIVSYDPVSIPPAGYYLSNNFPNPFNPTTKITYGLPIDFKLNITVYDILGNEIEVLFNRIQTAGNYTIVFNGSNLPSGIYFMKFKSGAFIQTRKMLLLK